MYSTGNAVCCGMCSANILLSAMTAIGACRALRMQHQVVILKQQAHRLLGRGGGGEMGGGAHRSRLLGGGQGSEYVTCVSVQTSLRTSAQHHKRNIQYPRGAAEDF